MQNLCIMTLFPPRVRRNKEKHELEKSSRKNKKVLDKFRNSDIIGAYERG